MELSLSVKCGNSAGPTAHRDRAPSPQTTKELKREEGVRTWRTAVQKTVGGKGLLETERLWGSLKVPDTKPFHGSAVDFCNFFLFIYALFIVVIIS